MFLVNIGFNFLLAWNKIYTVVPIFSWRMRIYYSGNYTFAYEFFEIFNKPNYNQFVWWMQIMYYSREHITNWCYHSCSSIMRRSRYTLHICQLKRSELKHVPLCYYYTTLCTIHLSCANNDSHVSSYLKQFELCSSSFFPCYKLLLLNMYMYFLCYVKMHLNCLSQELANAGSTKRPTCCVLVLTKPTKGELAQDEQEKLKSDYDQVVTDVSELASTLF